MATRKLPAERTKHAGLFARTRTHRRHELAPSPVVLVSLIESEDRARYARHCHARGASVFEDRVTRALSAHFNSLVLGRTNWYAYNNKCKFCAWTRVYRLLALKVICAESVTRVASRVRPLTGTLRSRTRTVLLRLLPVRTSNIIVVLYLSIPVYTCLVLCMRRYNGVLSTGTSTGTRYWYAG